MKHFDNPGLSLSEGIKSLMNCSSGNMEDIVREVFVAVACFVQNSKGPNSNIGGLDESEAFGKAAAQEYKELEEYRRKDDEARAAREVHPDRYKKPIDWDIAKRMLSKEITKEEMYRLNDERLAAEAAAKASEE